MKGGSAKYLAALKAAIPDPVSDRRGVILVAVLWICALVTWFAFQIAAETRLQGEDFVQSIRKSQALHLAIGGCYEALGRMGQTRALNADEPADRNWQPDGKPRLVKYDTGRAVVIVEPEGMKVNVNKTGQLQLVKILEKAGADDGTAENLADLIMDFIDQDDTPRLHGGEAPFYQSKGLNYVPFNGALTSLDQLLLIPGLTQKLFYSYGRSGYDLEPELDDLYKDLLIPGKYSLFNMLTIYGNNKNVPRFMDEEANLRQTTWKNGEIYRVLSFGISDNGPPSVGLWLTVRFSSQGKKPYTVLSRKVL